MSPAGATAAIVLAAGKGTRMMSDLPKVLHPVAGRPMIDHVLAAAHGADAGRVVVVLSPGLEAVADRVAPALVAIQDPPLGTGHAVTAALPALGAFDGIVLVLFGDTPLITPETLRRLRAALDGPEVAVAVLGFRPPDPGDYGRLVLDDQGRLDRIVEAREATPAERALTLCNAGVMGFAGRQLPGLVGAIRNDNGKGEYYLTDAVAIARGRGLRCVVVEGETDEVLGVNSRVDLAVAEKLMQHRLRLGHMQAGVTFEDPASVRLCWDTRLGRDVTVAPQVVFGPGVTVEAGARIEAFCHLEQAVVGPGAAVGPFARLRPGTRLDAKAKIGNFVETKNTHLGPGAKASHLTYLGDAEVGAEANIGAGTITCNYDGVAKHRTVIGSGAFIGSNTALVAPVTVGEGAIIGAGSVVTTDVAADALFVARPPSVERPGAAARFRAARPTRKDRSKG